MRSDLGYSDTHHDCEVGSYARAAMARSGLASGRVLPLRLWLDISLVQACVVHETGGLCSVSEATPAVQAGVATSTPPALCWEGCCSSFASLRSIGELAVTKACVGCSLDAAGSTVCDVLIASSAPVPS
jgi:hypothetical protein